MNSDSFPVWILERRRRRKSDFTFDFLYTEWDVTSVSLKFTLPLHNIHPAASSASPTLQGPGLCGLQLKHTHKMMNTLRSVDFRLALCWDNFKACVRTYLT